MGRLRIARCAPGRAQVSACQALVVAWFASEALVVGASRTLLVAHIFVEDEVTVDHVAAGTDIRLAIFASLAREAAAEF